MDFDRSRTNHPNDFFKKGLLKNFRKLTLNTCNRVPTYHWANFNSFMTEVPIIEKPVH